MTRNKNVNDHKPSKKDEGEGEYEESKDFDEINKNYFTDLKVRVILIRPGEKPKQPIESDEIDEDEDLDYEKEFEATTDKKGKLANFYFDLKREFENKIYFI